MFVCLKYWLHEGNIELVCHIISYANLCHYEPTEKNRKAQGTEAEEMFTYASTFEKSWDGDITKLSAEFDHEIRC